MSVYKIKGVGIDTTNIRYNTDFSGFDYLYTSISANNEGIIRVALKESIASLITGIDYLDRCEEIIPGYLKLIDRDKIDLLLINSNCDLEKYHLALGSLVENKFVDQIGIKNPKNPEELKRLMDIVKFKYISLDLSPLNFNYDIVKWCNENNVDILVFNPFGGYVTAPNQIESFSVPYLFNFSAVYGTLVFLSGRDTLTALEGREYLTSLMGNEYDTNIYNLDKNVNKLVKPLKKVIKTSLIPGIDIKSSISNSYNYLYSSEDYEFSFTESKEDFEETEVKDDVEESVYKYLDTIVGLEDSTKASDIISSVKYDIVKIISEVLNVDFNNIVLTPITDSFLAIGVMFTKTKTYLLKEDREIITKINSYYLGCNDNGKITFKTIKSTIIEA